MAEMQGVMQVKESEGKERISWKEKKNSGFLNFIFDWP